MKQSLSFLVSTMLKIRFENRRAGTIEISIGEFQFYTP